MGGNYARDQIQQYLRDHLFWLAGWKCCPAEGTSSVMMIPARRCNTAEARAKATARGAQKDEEIDWCVVPWCRSENGSVFHLSLPVSMRIAEWNRENAQKAQELNS